MSNTYNNSYSDAEFFSAHNGEGLNNTSSAHFSSAQTRADLSVNTCTSRSIRSQVSKRQANVSQFLNRTTATTTSRAANSRQQQGIFRTAHDFSTTSNLFSSVIMSVVEGRGQAKGEIGLAYIDLNSPILHLVQFRDNCSFDSLKMKCHVCQPIQIIYPNTLTQNNMMMSSLVEYFSDANFAPFDRRFFNEKKGLEFVKSLCYKDYTGIDIELESKYYCLSACSALLQYIFIEKKVVFVQYVFCKQSVIFVINFLTFFHFQFTLD